MGLSLSESPAVETDFIAGRFFPADDQPQSIVAADFNQDGHQDIATANSRSTSTLSIFLGDGRGSFAPAVNIPGGNVPRTVIAADFNLDGRIDLATAQINGQAFGVALGNGDGTFGPMSNVSIGDVAEFLVAGDFNEDGKQDLVVTSRDLGRTLLFLGNGAAGWSPPSIIASGFTPTCLAKGDFNNDSHLDLVLGRRNMSSLQALQGDGHGNFVVTSTPALPSDALAVSIADLTGDGKADLVAAGNDVTVLVGNGFGTFVTPVTYTAGGKGYDVETADFDEDGRLDVAVALSVNINSVSILRGIGGGVLSAPSLYRAGGWATDLAIRDFNEDGRLDVAAADLLGDDISLLLGDGKGALPVATRILPMYDIQQVESRDFNEDGRADILVANSLLSFYPGNGSGGFGAAQNSGGMNPPAAVGIADLNGDGHLDLTCAEPRYSSIPEEPPDPHLATYLGNGTGAFALHQELPLAVVPNFLVSGKFNGDANPDVVIAPSTGGLALYQGDGMGNMVAGSSFASGVVYSSLSVGDVDKDGSLDLIALGTSSSVFYGNGTGGFAPGPMLTIAGGTPREAVTGDFNEDGIVDIAVAACVRQAPNPPAFVNILLGDGSRGFVPAASLAEYCPMRIEAADFNRDGHLDLAVADDAHTGMYLLLGRGDGSFLTLPGFLLPSDASLAVGDFDGNGMPDLAPASSDPSASP